MKPTEDQNKSNRTGFKLFIVLGSLFVIVGAVWMVRTASFVLRASKAPGMVVEMERGGPYDGLTYDTPILTFADRSGIVHTQRLSTTVSSSSTFKLGDKVSILYDPSKPEHWEMDTFTEVWGSSLTFIGFGLLVGGLPCLLVFLSGRAMSTAVRIGAAFTRKRETREWEIQSKLKTSGVPAIATVTEANPEARLHYRIDKDTRTNLDDHDFVSLETFKPWEPSQADAGIKKGDQFRAYLDPLNPFKNFYVDFSDRIGYDPLGQSNESIEDEENELVAKLTSLATTSSPYLSQESLSEIQELIEDDDLSLAFEKLVTRIMNLPEPFPAPLQNVDWDDCFELGVNLGLDDDTEDDPGFWRKFRAFTQVLNHRKGKGDSAGERRHGPPITDPDFRSLRLPAKDLREEFRPVADRYRRRWLIYYSGAIIGMLTGITVALRTDWLMDRLGILVLPLGFVLLSLCLIFLPLLGPKLRCPGCRGSTRHSFDLDRYCPQCGRSSLREITGGDDSGHKCDSCEFVFWRATPFRLHFCTHCGAYLDERGPKNFFQRRRTEEGMKP